MEIRDNSCQKNRKYRLIYKFTKKFHIRNTILKKILTMLLKSNSELRTEARQALSGKWAENALFYFVYTLIVGGCGGTLGFIIPGGGGFIISLLLAPMAYNAIIAFLRQLRGDSLELGDLFQNFKSQPWVTLIYKYIYTMLWTLLLIIPGIVKSYSYAMTEYLIHDDPTLVNDAAIDKSMAMMSGHKLDLFLLDLSFIGWYLLGILSFGIGMFWVIPYHYTARAAFYEELKNEGSYEK